jgi:hypothetical protein
MGNVIDLLDRKYATDASGQWALNFPPDVFPVRLGTKERQPIDIDVTIRYPDATPVVERVQLAPAAETRLGETALRGRVQTTAGRALAGAVVTIGGFQGTSTSDAIGHYTYFFAFGEALPGSVTVTATLPDGRQRATPASVELRQTKPVPTLVFN